MTLPHVGIVACSAEGAALCYRTLCAEGEALFGPHGHPEVSMHTLPLADYARCLDLGGGPGLQGVAALMLRSAEKLAAIGADFLVCPDNTIHAALPLLRDRSPRPWLHIAEVVADEAVSRGFGRIAISGTRWLVDSDVYPDALHSRGLQWLRPEPAERDAVHDLIMQELVRGRIPPHAVPTFQRIYERQRAAGCDAVVLGCTEIPLVMNDANSPLPTLDSTRLLARAALRRAAELMR